MQGVLGIYFEGKRPLYRLPHPVVLDNERDSRAKVQHGGSPPYCGVDGGVIGLTATSMAIIPAVLGKMQPVSKYFLINFSSCYALSHES